MKILMTPPRAEIDPVATARRRRRTTLVLAFVPVVALLLAWELAARGELIDTRIFPAPSGIFRSGWELTTSGELLEHVYATCRRLVVGYLLGMVLGLALGVILGRVRLLRAAFAPTLAGLYAIPKLGIFPLLLLIFGIGESPKIVITAYATFIVIAIASTDAFASVPSSYLDVAKTVAAPRRVRLFEIILPAALPQIFTAARVALGIALLVVIAVEFVASNEGLGFLIWNSWSVFQPEKMYVGIMLSAIVGVLLTSVINGVQRICVPWERGGRASFVQ